MNEVHLHEALLEELSYLEHIYVRDPNTKNRLIKNGITNGIFESINAKTQLEKKARGFRNIKNLINIIYFIAGKLKFNYPLYST